jgi:hypothetical protein
VRNFIRCQAREKFRMWVYIILVRLAARADDLRIKNTTRIIIMNG